MELKQVIFSFTNKKGEIKTVFFVMDKNTYDVYHDPTVPKEWTEKMMLDEYREYCQEQKYKRRVIAWPVDKDGKELDIPDKDNLSPLESLIEEEKVKENKNKIKNILKQLTEKQRQVFEKVYIEEKQPMDVAKELGISKSALYERLQSVKDVIKIIKNQKK